jgi:hypothetical protein
MPPRSLSLGFHSRIDREGPSTWYQSQGHGFYLARSRIFAVLFSPSLARSTYSKAILNTHMTRVCSRGSHTVGEILD